jgi:hypothetical protein
MAFGGGFGGFGQQNQTQQTGGFGGFGSANNTTTGGMYQARPFVCSFATFHLLFSMFLLVL